MGVVYEAFDREQQTRVALKTLRRMTPDALFQFKHEFRALQDVEHPNLVRLGELVEEAGQWFFTMELVEGVSFLHRVRPPTLQEIRPGWTDGDADDSLDTQATRTVTGGSGNGDGGRFDEALLRDALRQLAAALHALHRAGKVHRDVKPSNILIAPDGRVVLLDFGVVADVRGSELADDERVVGTVAYMPPEQALGLRVSPAADWYSLGVILFEALTGQLPFARGSVEQVAKRKPPPPPSKISEGIPGDLDDLCVELLRSDPEARPSAADVLRVLGATETGALDAFTHSYVTAAVPFIGRNQELAELTDVFDECALADVPAAVVVHGESGVGKTALVSAFVDRLGGDSTGTISFHGRCYERESVPYRALDGVMDALSQYLSRLDQVEAALLLPPQVGLVARVFPVLRRVAAVRKAETGVADVHDPQELRTRAFRALRELIGRLASGRRVVVYIDDFQWADADSMALLREILHPPDAPPILLLLTQRLSASGELDRGAELVASTRHMLVEALSFEQSVELVRRIAAGLDVTAALDAAAIAREARGHPLYLYELVQHAAATGATGGEVTRLEDALQARIARLDDAARRFVAVLAVAGAPVPLTIAAAACGLTTGEAARNALSLRYEMLVRATGTRAVDRVEPYHDRVRESVVAALSDADRVELHAKLADAIEAADPSLRDPHMLVRQLEAAGATTRAAHQAELAARLHEEAFAFDQAASLYRTALRLGEHAPDERRRLQVKLGDALVNAGRCAQSADVYLDAADGANDAVRLDLRRRAAEQNLISGHLDRGLALLRAVLAEAGLKLPTTPGRAVLSLLWQRLRLRLRGLAWKARDASRIAPRDLERLELHRAVALGLSFVDNIRGAGFQARGLLLALKLGEESHVARAILLEAGYRATQGAKLRDGLDRLLDVGTRIAVETQDPYLKAWVPGVTGVCDYLSGRFVEAARRLREAEALWIKMPGGNWELNHLRILWLLVMRRMGTFKELFGLYDEYMRDAERRGDRLAETTFARALNQVWLARDDPDRARVELERSEWTSETGFLHLQNWYQIESRVELGLYESATGSLHEQFGDSLDAVGRSLLMRIQIVRTGYWYLRARLVLAESDALDDAKKLARRLERERVPYAVVWAKLLRAGYAHRCGDRDGAMKCLREATLLGEEHHLLLCAAAARRRLGELLSPDEGKPMIEAADAWMTGELIRNPARMAALVAPGFDRVTR